MNACDGTSILQVINPEMMPMCRAAANFVIEDKDAGCPRAR